MRSFASAGRSHTSAVTDLGDRSGIRILFFGLQAAAAPPSDRAGVRLTPWEHNWWQFPRFERRTDSRDRRSGRFPGSGLAGWGETRDATRLRPPTPSARTPSTASDSLRRMRAAAVPIVLTIHRPLSRAWCALWYAGFFSNVRNILRPWSPTRRAKLLQMAMTNAVFLRYLSRQASSSSDSYYTSRFTGLKITEGDTPSAWATWPSSTPTGAWRHVSCPFLVMASDRGASWLHSAARPAGDPVNPALIPR